MISGFKRVLLPLAGCLSGGQDSIRMPVSVINLKNSLEEIQRMTDFVQEFGKSVGLSEWDTVAFSLAIEELMTNTIDYGYAGIPEGEAELSLEMRKEGDRIRAVLTDTGVAFNPLEQEEADLTIPVEDRAIGGLGVHLVKKMMDHVSYEHREGRNIIRMDRVMGPVDTK